MKLRPLERKAIFEIKAYIEVHYSEQITLDSLSGMQWQDDQVNFRPRRLHEAFSATFLQTIRAYHTHLKMQKAKDLLETTDLSVKAIANTLGFKGVNNFSAAFKKHHHLTPSEYRDKSIFQ